MPLPLHSLAILVAAGCGAAPPPTPESPALPPPPTASEIQPLVDQLAHETAALRHLSLDRPVPVVIQTPEEITAELRHELDEDHEQIDVEQQVGIALGEFPPDFHLAEALSRFVGAEALGYYDPGRGRLVLSSEDARSLDAPNTPAGVEARATIVHEIVHALQHQHFAVQVDGSDAPVASFGDAARARLALLEGDATVVALDWSQRRRGSRLLGTSDQIATIVRWMRNVQVLTEVNVPAYLVESAEQPYEAGATAVGVLHSAGGFARIDALLGASNLRTAEVFHATRPGGSVWVDVPVTEDETSHWRAWQIAPHAAMALGEGELRLYLGLVMHTERAAGLAEAWRGDRFTWGASPRGLACRWEIARDTEPHAQAIVDGLRPLAERWRRDGCSAIAGSTVTTCPAVIEAHGTHVVIARGGA